MNCGECTECCELLHIDSRKPLKENEIEVVQIMSPAGELCAYCEKNKGCTIHEKRPTICRTFQCMYTQHNVAPVELRPDKCGIIFEKLDDDMIVGTIKPNRPVSEIGAHQITTFNTEGYTVVLTKYDDDGVKIFCNNEMSQREALIKFANYRRIANG